MTDVLTSARRRWSGVLAGTAVGLVCLVVSVGLLPPQHLAAFDQYGYHHSADDMYFRRGAVTMVVGAAGYLLTGFTGGVLTAIRRTRPLGIGVLTGAGIGVLWYIAAMAVLMSLDTYDG
jgi:hypothetical protein